MIEMNSRKCPWITPSECDVKAAALRFCNWHKDKNKQIASTATPTNVIKATLKDRNEVLDEINKYMSKDIGADGFINRNKTGICFGSDQKGRRVLFDDGKHVTPRKETRGKFRCALNLVKLFVERNIYRTLRSFFYLGKNQFGEQTAANTTLSQLCVELSCSRSSCNLFPTDRGYVIGDLKYLVEGREVDCNAEKSDEITLKLGEMVPAFIRMVRNIKVGPQINFILLVEKYSVFIELTQNDFHNKYDCLIITGTGQPDTTTLEFTKRVMEESELPAFCLVDSDPYGMEIALKIKFGSINSAHESKNLACTSMYLLGLYPSELEKFGIGEEILHVSKEYDLVTSLTGSDMMIDDDVFRNELMHMQTHRRKAQLENMSVFGINCLATDYLPYKLIHCFSTFMGAAANVPGLAKSGNKDKRRKDRDQKVKAKKQKIQEPAVKVIENKVEAMAQKKRKNAEISSVKETPKFAKKAKPSKKIETESDSDEDEDSSDDEPSSKTEKPKPKTPTSPEASGFKTLYASNLSFRIVEEDVEKFFKEVGQVVEVHFSAEGGQLKRYGHVEFATAEAARKALKLNGKYLCDRPVRLEPARERDNEVFVKGFDTSQGENEIRSSLKGFFASCGEITRLSIPKDRASGKIKGMAFMHFKDAGAFNKALELHGSYLGGRYLTVQVAKPPGDFGGRFGGGRRGGRGGRDGGFGGHGGRDSGGGMVAVEVEMVNDSVGKLNLAAPWTGTKTTFNVED